MVNIPSFKTDEDLYEFGYQIVHKIKRLEDQVLQMCKFGKAETINAVLNSVPFFEENEVTDFYNSVINSKQQQITELKSQLKALNQVRIEF
jgi:hypothetical protein